MRRDGSSKFFTENRWGNFWSLSAGWRLDEENFIKNFKFINLLKLRTSYGATGNDAGIGYYAWQALFDLGLNNAAEPGLIQSSLSNTSLTWESNNQFDAAIEFGFLNKISGSIEFYRRTSSNLLFAVPLPPSSGITTQDQNVGSMYNQGFEFHIAADVVKKNDFNWNIDFNFSTLKNSFTKLPEGQKEIIKGTKKLMVGQSIYDFWLRGWYGVDPADGRALYLANDKNMTTQATNLRVIGADTVTTSQNNALYHYNGTAIPDLIGGVTNTFSYKGIVLSVLTTFQIGGKYYDSNYAGLMSAGTYGNAFHPDILKRWQNVGDITNVPRLDAGRVTEFGAASDRFLVDASYLAVKSISLGYNFPSSLVKKLNVGNARIYLSGENIRLFNARKGLDSQQSFGGTTDNLYSPSRTIIVGINITL